MPGPRILFVKLSSLGDVVHNLPAVTELLEHRPGAHIGWLVEEAYAPLVALHPGVREVIPLGLRGLRRSLLSPPAWGRLRSARAALRHGDWDFVVDTQGLVKSGWMAAAARGARFGLDRRSAREPFAARFYDVRIRVPRELHAVERIRRQVGQVFGYAPAGPPRYGVAPPERPAWVPAAPYAVLLHAASRARKRWPEAHWGALARLLAESGYATVFPGGTADERRDAARIAGPVPGAMAAPAMTLREAAGLLGHADMVAGVDTGLTHLAVALGRPTVGIYCATRPALTGLHGGDSRNLGGPGVVPTVEEVAAALGYRAPE